MKLCVKQVIFVLVMVFVLGGFNSAIAAEDEDEFDMPPLTCQQIENELSSGTVSMIGYLVFDAAYGCCAHALRWLNDEYRDPTTNLTPLTSLAQDPESFLEIIKSAKAQCGSSSETVRILENAAR